MQYFMYIYIYIVMTHIFLIYLDTLQYFPWGSTGLHIPCCKFSHFCNSGLFCGLEGKARPPNKDDNIDQRAAAARCLKFCIMHAAIMRNIYTNTLIHQVNSLSRQIFYEHASEFHVRTKSPFCLGPK
jgi:hypothetical protein